jgi:hypothetical protein
MSYPTFVYLNEKLEPITVSPGYKEPATVNGRITSHFIKIRDISSVGLEHYLDKVGVTGSSPVCPTFKSIRNQGYIERFFKIILQ